MKKTLTIVMILLLVLSMFVVLVPRQVASSSSWTIKQLTKNDVEDSLPECAHYIAKKGKIAFDRRPSTLPPPNYGLDWDIYAMNITDEPGQEKQMTNAYGEDAQATISYDGSKIVFVSGRFNPGNPWDLEIFVINVTDEPGQEIQVSDNSTYFDVDPEISEDGIIVAWLTGPDTPYKHTEYITVANISDIHDITYTIIDTPEWDDRLSMTYDGSKVCFSQYTGQQDVYVANTDGTGLTPIPDTSNKEAVPLICGDGSKIAYMWRTSLDGGDWEISVYDMLSGTTTRLTDNNVDDVLGSITRDGNLVAYTREGDIYFHNLSQETRITNDPYEDWYPKLDEDGDTIVFQSLGRDGPDSEIFVMTSLLSATVDIDPDTLNLKSNGQWITAYITLPEGYKVEDIVLETVYLDGISAAWSEIQNGVYMVKFDRAMVQTCLTNEPDYESAPKFYDLTLTVTGELVDGTSFEGTDTITVIKK